MKLRERDGWQTINKPQSRASLSRKTRRISVNSVRIRCRKRVTRVQHEVQHLGAVDIETKRLGVFFFTSKPDSSGMIMSQTYNVYNVLRILMPFD